MRSAPFGEPPCSSTMSGCLAWTLSSLSQIRRWSLKSSAAGEGDLGPGGEQHLVFGAALGGEEVAAVDHRRGQRAVVDLRSGARPPGRAGVALELVGGLVAEELHAVAALDQRLPLGDEALEFDRADFRAVLFLLAAPLRLLVVVEFALDAADGAVEEIDGRPEQVFEVGFEAGVARVTTRASKMSATAPAMAWPSGSGLGSGSSWKGR